MDAGRRTGADPDDASLQAFPFLDSRDSGVVLGEQIPAVGEKDFGGLRQA